MRNHIGIVLLAFLISACSSLQNTGREHHALCQQLKNRIVMNGATGDQMAAQEQRAELGNLNRTYLAEDCI